MLLGERPLLAGAISNGGRPCLLLYVVVQDFVEKAACCGGPSATVVRLLNAIVGRKNSLPHNFADRQPTVPLKLVLRAERLVLLP
jgi:hypothetical protein